MKIKKIDIRKILNSGGKYSVEVKLFLNNGYYGIASSPSALIPGKREVKTTDYDEINEDVIENLKKNIYKIGNINQKKLDEYLKQQIITIGSDITLAISLAFARASSNYKYISLIKYIELLTNIKSNETSPIPLIAIFSGGVHNSIKKDTLQQIMISVNTNDFEKAINVILDIYNKIEKYLKENNMFVELGSSSGFVVKNISTQEQFELLTKTINELDYQNIVSIGIDVAAEHLKHDDTYIFENTAYKADEFYNLIEEYLNKYNISFIEDPFDSQDKNYWIKLKNNHNNIDIVGDDLFATQKEYVNKEEANTIIIKMNQAGTLTDTLNTINKARNNSIKLCVSHRSLETEDTFMCDLAVAVNSEYIKIGGPRRNDRIAKYNKLLEITKNTRN